VGMNGKVSSVLLRAMAIMFISEERRIISGQYCNGPAPHRTDASALESA
jgi:hypothetical protein